MAHAHFAKSPLVGIVPAMVTAITVLEVAAGALSALGCVMIMILRDSTLAFYGAIIAAIAIVALFFGQRMAKDYGRCGRPCSLLSAGTERDVSAGAAVKVRADG